MAGRFRQRLVALVDALLEHPDGGPFLLDGQGIVLEDYLSVRPERLGALRTALASGAVEAGPWYVLADNLIPSGEAILRNLEAGRRELDRLGAPSPRIAYCPDTFGHPAAMPMIAAGYGFPLAIVWRGLGGAQHPSTDTLWWESPSGDRVLVHHLPPDGYETGSALPLEPSLATTRWHEAARLLSSRNRTGVVLLPNGADHHARQPSLDRAVTLGNDALRGALEMGILDRNVTMKRVSMSDAAQTMVRAALELEAGGEALPVVQHELRDSYGYTWTLQGTFATRAHQKRRNAKLERALLHDVEPWIALALIHDARAGSSAREDGQVGLAQLPSLLAHAWRTLLRTHPHDTLCGCSIDGVARAMDAAQEDVAAQAIGLRDAALGVALHQDAVANRSRTPHEAPSVLVRNCASRPRSGVAEVRLIERLQDVPVGPGSAGHVVAVPDAYQLVHGDRVQAGRVITRHDRRESAQHYPDNDLVREHRVLAWLPTVPPLGVRIFDSGLTADDGSHAPTTHATLSVVDGELVLDNGRLTVAVSSHGIEMRHGDRVLRNCLAVESQLDRGDSYTPSLRGPVRSLEIVQVTPGATGPLRATCMVHWRLRTADGESVQVRTVLILDAGADALRCDVTIVNRMRDHRLRIVWRTDIGPVGAATWADAAFGPVRRESIPIVADARYQARETPPLTMPLHRFMTNADAARGATVISDGLAEGEVRGAALAVTLLRAVGELSRADLPERPGHAGWPAPVPAAQCLGRYRARLGFMLHDEWSRTTIAHIDRSADDLLTPLAGETLRDAVSLPAHVAGPELVGEGLRASAVTVSRDGQALILRVVNLTDAQLDGAWVLPPGRAWRYARCRLDETVLSDEIATVSRIGFTIGPRDVLTFRIARVGD